MRIYLKKLSFLLVSFVLLFSACETEESFQITSPKAEFKLNTPGISNIYLNFALPENPAFTISWEDEVTGSSTYDIEMATDAEFTAPMSLGSTNEKIFSMSVANFNSILNDAGITSYENTGVYIRIKADGSLSNSILMLITTYAIEAPVITAPDTGFGVTLSDIDPEAVAMTISWDDPEIGENSTATVNYDIEIAETGTDFATIYSVGITQNLTLETYHEALNELVLAIGGTANEVANYDVRIKATVETEAGDLIRTSDLITISVTPYETVLPDKLYVVGAGAVDAGWSWDSPVELKLQGSVYSGNIRLTPDNGGNFRFFTEFENWGSGQNYTYYEVRGYTFDPNLSNANDGDSNFLFTGTEGEYSIKIDTANETITLGPPIEAVFEASEWGIVGSATPNQWNGPDIPFYTTSENNVFVAYSTLIDGEIKFRQNNSWDAPNINYGDNGADGSLEEGGANINVVAGTYKIVFDLNNLTYTVEPFSLGITGSGSPTGWPADPQTVPDVKFSYDAFSDTWKVIVPLTDGEIKFRTNDSWDVNYGDDGNDGTLDQNGSNIAVNAGNYIITVDLNNLEYSLQQIDHIWGITGSGSPTGWPADPQTVPDVKFTRDFTTADDVWFIESIVLSDGEIKFRSNDSWDLNYGDDGADGTLDQNGSNIAVAAGTYKIRIDFSNASSPTYTIE